MSEFWFKTDKVQYRKEALLEKSKVIDLTDPKWGHPEVTEGWNALLELPGPLSRDIQSPEQPWEKVLEAAHIVNPKTAEEFAQSHVRDTDTVTVTVYTVPGCPEEPETSVPVIVMRPKSVKSKKARVMYFLMPGGLTCWCGPDQCSMEEVALMHKCVIVTPVYRLAWQAKYPAAMNDAHAGYKWMIENAQALQIDPDRVVVYGASSGGHLCTALGFRLKRYGYSPRGIVAINPQTDDSQGRGAGDGLFTGVCDTMDQHDFLLLYMGRNHGMTATGPEALANHATVEDCIGYPPCFIHTLEFDPDVDNCRMFYGKLLQARSYCELHSWGGARHESPVIAIRGADNDYARRAYTIIDGNIEDCFKYDLRRPWVVEDYKEAFKARFGELHTTNR